MADFGLAELKDTFLLFFHLFPQVLFWTCIFPPTKYSTYLIKAKTQHFIFMDFFHTMWGFFPWNFSLSMVNTSMQKVNNLSFIGW